MHTARTRSFRDVLPARELALLMAIGFIDLVMTAVLHSKGLIVELNPLMRPLIETSEWLFAAVKAGTLVFAWAALAWYAQHNLAFVRRWSAIGVVSYVTIWTVWFSAAAGTAMA